jgi:cytochrome c oxidase subunit 2
VLLLAGCRKPAFTGPPDQRVHVLMKNWEIVPETIVIARNAKVELTIDGLDIDESVRRGKPAVVRLIAGQAGTYVMRCSILCGRGHDQMKGKIVVR